MCTRFLWSSSGTSGSGQIIVGRSMDWFEDTRTKLAIMPKGIERESYPGNTGNFKWTSKYGSVVSLMYGEITVDGINSEGFQVSGLYLAESDYGQRNDSRPGIMLAVAIQYLLDQFDTVAKAVEWFKESNTQIIPIDLGGKPGTGHLALADSGGDSAILEFLDGDLRVHHGEQYTVMANSPAYDEQMELQKRYAGLGGDGYLPGDTDSPDRFARAAYYSRQLPPTTDPRLAIAQAFSVIRNASAPFGTPDPSRPYISTTRWRTVADLTDKFYFYESTSSPSMVWVSLSKVDFSIGSGIRELDLVNEPDHAGDVTSSFVQMAQEPATV